MGPKKETIKVPSRKLTAKWTVENQQDLRSIYQINEIDVIWVTVRDIEDERRKRESARSRNNQRSS